MVERLTWKKLAWELAFFLPPVIVVVDIWIHAVAASGCHGFAVGMALT